MTPRLTRTLLLAAGIAVLVTAIFHWILKELKDRSFSQQFNLKFYEGQVTVSFGQAGEGSGRQGQVALSLQEIRTRLMKANFRFEEKQADANEYLFSFSLLQDTASIRPLFTNSGRLSMLEVYTIDQLSDQFTQADTALAAYFQAHPVEAILKPYDQPRTLSQAHPLFSVLPPARPYADNRFPGYLAMVAEKDTTFAKQLMEHPAISGFWPADCRFLYGEKDGAQAGYVLLYAVKNHPSSITNRNIVRAKAELNTVTHEPVVIIDLDAYGTTAFERLTARNVGRQLAICINDKVITAPMVNQAVYGGKVQITAGSASGGSVEQAAVLSTLLTSTDIPLPVHITEARFSPIDKLAPSLWKYVLVFGVSFALALGIQGLIIRLNAS